MSSKIVKLYIYAHENEEVLVDVFEAKDWGDFVIVKVKGALITEEGYQALIRTFDDYHKQTNKSIILIDDHVDVEFYGVEVDNEG